MKIKFQKEIKSGSGLLVLPLYKDKLKNPAEGIPKNIRAFIKDRVKDDEFKGKFGETLSTYQPEKIVLVGLGGMEKFKSKRARDIGGILGKYFRSKLCEDVSIVIPEDKAKYIAQIYEGVLLSQYVFDKFKSKKKKDKKFELKKVTFVVDKKLKGISDKLEKVELIVEAVNFTKDLVNFPKNYAGKEYLVQEAKGIAKKNKYKYAIFGEKELKKMKWGNVLAVNRGSSTQARVVVFEYNGGKRKEKPIAIVGKGVVFDSGGYNLKPSSFIETMHQDMAGCAVVLGLFKILKKMAVKKNVVAVIPIVENLIGSNAYKPSDIITSYSGKTVEITNTDAEGRLILSDAITYASEFKPEYLITVATLTGAVAVALGNRYAGLLGNDRALARKLEKAGRITDDLGWPLPLHEDFLKKMDSKIADVRNTDTGTARFAGCSKGAAFLEKFIENNKWCHIDIGGTSYTDDPKKYEQNGATAHGLRMLVKFLESL